MEGVESLEKPVPGIDALRQAVPYLRWRTQTVAIVSPLVGGLGVGFFGCMLPYARRLKEGRGYHTSRTRALQVTATTGSFVFSLFSLLPLALGAPINVVNVVRAGALLPSNAFFSQLFGLRPLLRDDYLGTLVTISGVSCFVLFVGPPGPERNKDEFLDQVSKPVPLAFNVIILAMFVGSAGWMAAHRKGQGYQPAMLLALTVSILISCCISAMDVATKGWSAALRSGDGLELPLFWVSFLIQACFFAISKVGLIYGCTNCDVLIFVPLNIVLNIFFAVAAGMVVLGEASQVPSTKAWLGLVASTASVVAGILMLVTGPASQEHTQKYDSEDAADDPSTSREDGELPVARRESTETDEENVIPFWCLLRRIFTSKATALARMNRVHIRTANAGLWCREKVRHLRRRFDTQPPSSGSPSLTSDDGESSESPTEAAVETRWAHSDCQ